jgi:hypothetical protein
MRAASTPLGKSRREASAANRAANSPPIDANAARATWTFEQVRTISRKAVKGASCHSPETDP